MKIFAYATLIIYFILSFLVTLVIFEKLHNQDVRFRIQKQRADEMDNKLDSMSL